MRYNYDTAFTAAAPAIDIPECPIAFARGLLRFEPDPQQERVLASGARFGILNCSRQWGKSTLMAIMILHKALRNPASLSLCIGSVHRQSLELLDKIVGFAWHMGLKVTGGRSKGIVLPNQSRILALPCAGEKLRGYSAVKMLVIDEAAQVPDHVYLLLRPMLLSSRGDLWLISTPFGRRGFFYKQWIGADPEWARFAVPASECPRFHPQELERERKLYSARFFDQEFNCAFVDPDDALFPLDLLDRATVDDSPLNLQ